MQFFFPGHPLVRTVSSNGIPSECIGCARMFGTATIPDPGLPIQLIEGLVLPQRVINIFMILYVLSGYQIGVASVGCPVA